MAEIDKRKCGADFDYLTEGSDKTQAKINDKYPTLEQIWGIDAWKRYVLPYAKQEMSVIRRPFCL